MPNGPSSTVSPFLVPTRANVSFTSIITTGDALPFGGVFGGIPDGIGAFDNGNGTFTLLVNHELGATAGLVRDHGSTGAYVTRLVVDSTTLNVVANTDLIQSLNLWDDATDTYVNGTTAFSRFCSSDLAAPTAFYNAATGLGTNVRIYLTGEEAGSEGRAVGTVVNGANAGTAYELPFLGNLSFENVLANPYAQNSTIVAMTDDATGGQVYIYIGQKQNTGTEVDRAGLTNGHVYGMKVDGITLEVNGTPVSGHFSLQEMGVGGDVSNMTGAQLDAESVAEGVTGFLRPEDAAWDPDHPNTLYFATTNSFTGNSRLYRATFTDITHPELGGTVEAVLDGTEGQRMFDNITIANGKIILQEDPGNQSYVAKLWEYDIASDTLTQIAQFDPARFTPGAPGFITQDEESSGVLDVTSFLGNAHQRAYLMDAQVHAATNNPATVEQGQLMVMYVNGAANVGRAGDYNGDGRDDILWSNTNGAFGNWLGGTSGGFTINNAAGIGQAPAGWHIMANGDFNGDGRDDILWRNDNGAVGNWLANANGSFTDNSAAGVTSVSQSWHVAGVADFNGDGKDDILWRNDNGQFGSWSGAAGGRFTVNSIASAQTATQDWHIVGTGDFNGDGRADILWRNDNGALGDWLGQANGGFTFNTAAGVINVDTGFYVAGVGDFNGDGRDDILWRNSSTGETSNWLGTANGGFFVNQASVQSASTGWEVASTGDFNGDGRDDVLWRGNNGDLTEWLGSANGTFVTNDLNAHAQVATSWSVTNQAGLWV